jgi:hypothetical protein
MPLNLLFFIAAIILIITAAILYYVFIIKPIDSEQSEAKYQNTVIGTYPVKATLYIEVFENGDIDTVSIKGYGSKKILRESIIKVMAKSDSYFELFMECAAIHMLDEKNKKVI